MWPRNAVSFQGIESQAVWCTWLSSVFGACIMSHNREVLRGAHLCIPGTPSHARCRAHLCVGHCAARRVGIHRCTRQCGALTAQGGQLPIGGESVQQAGGLVMRWRGKERRNFNVQVSHHRLQSYFYRKDSSESGLLYTFTTILFQS